MRLALATTRAARVAFLAAVLVATAPSAPALGSRIAETSAAIIELRDGTGRVDALPFALAALEAHPRDAPRRLGFRPDPALFAPAARLGFRDLLGAKAVWLCFTVRSAASARSWLLEAGPNRGEIVGMYAVDPDGGVESQALDPSLEAARRSRPPSGNVFRLTIGPGQVKTVYLRFEAEGIVSLRASIWDSFEYMKADELESGFTGILFGVIVAVFLYTLFIAISLREGSYALYLAYLLAFLAFVVAASGAGQSYFWPGSSWAGKRVQALSMILMDCGIVLFARSFLDTSRISRMLSRTLSAVACLSLPAAACLAFLDLRAATIAIVDFDFLARLAVLAISLVAALARPADGYNPRRARFFTASYSLAFAGCLVARLGQMGAIPAIDSLWASGEEIGVLAQILILSHGITDAINAVRAEKDEGQRRSIELLERANRVKEDFVIGTSLEFRSPLFGIIGLVNAVEALSAGRAGPEERRLSALVKAEALRLLGIVASIVVYARLRNGDLALVAERVSLRDIAEDASAAVSHIASGKDIAVEKSVEGLEFWTDGRALERIALNLFAEALKRSPSGIVGIEGRAAGDRVLLVVADSAPPLPDELLSRFRSSGDLEAVGPGIELLVARLLAERLGGSLRYSWSGGRGRFELDLPRKPPWGSGGGKPERVGVSSLLSRIAIRGIRPVRADLSETPPGKGSRGLVLAYDEDPVFLEALKRYLEGRGYAVAPTLSADKAVALASARRFDLVLLDASGRNRVGLDACARIRATRGLEELPIVVMTDRESAEAVEAAFRAGASDYLPKLSPNELLFARVDTHVALRRAVEEALETRRRVAELEKLKTLGVLAAGVAHEVNTPNNAVIRNLPVVSEVWRELSPMIRRLMDQAEGITIRGWSAEELFRELPELLADTYAAGLQIKKIVEDLKDYARDSSSSPPEAVDLSAVAAYAARLLQPLVGRSTRRFALDAPPGLPLARANFQKLTQVAVSVLENALQSLPGPEAGVSLRARHDPGRDRLVLECEDEGAGIDPAFLDKVFEPFFTTKRESGGTGLGLSVALGIVRDAGGEIEIESRRGLGTTVRVVLPAISESLRGSDERRE